MLSLQAKKKGYTGSGEISVDKCILRPVYTFLDYIKGGTQIFCTIAIDFTGMSIINCIFMHVIHTNRLICPISFI